MWATSRGPGGGQALTRDEGEQHATAGQHLQMQCNAVQPVTRRPSLGHELPACHTPHLTPQLTAHGQHPAHGSYHHHVAATITISYQAASAALAARNWSSLSSKEACVCVCVSACTCRCGRLHMTLSGQESCRCQLHARDPSVDEAHAAAAAAISVALFT